MGVGKAKSRGRSRAASADPAWRRAGSRGERRWAALLLASSACALDFDVAGRRFECPPEVTGCLWCNADGTCRDVEVIPHVEPEVEPPPFGSPEPMPAEPPDSSVPPGSSTSPLAMPPDSGEPTPAGGASDAGPGPTPSPEAGPSQPSPPEACAEFQSRASDTLCLNGSEQCFSLGNVLSPALAVWLDPTTLPRDGSRDWCDRSGKRHHAVLVPDGSDVVVEPDGRAVSDTLARSLELSGAWLSLREGSEPVLLPGNFAVVMAAAAPLEASDRQPFELFESGEQSRVNLRIVAETGKAEGRITSLETALVPSPVVTRSSVRDGGFHLYSLYRRSEVQVLDDVLQLRLNGVLEFRSSSIAIPRALDLSSSGPPRIGSNSATNGTSEGRGRVAAVVILRGSIPEDELARLENFLCQALAACAPPGPPLVSTPPAPGDAGL